MILRHSAVLLPVSLLLWGCSPFGRKSEPKELFPADSASRVFAQSVAPETPILNFRVDGGENAYFGSIRFGSDSALWIGDLGRHTIRRFQLDGSEVDSIAGFSFPYLVETDSTIDVYDAGLNRLIPARDTLGGLELPAIVGEQEALARQIAEVNGVIYLKDAAKPAAALYALENGSSRLLSALPGPFWHHYGVMREWQGRVLSVSSYRPVVYTYEPGTGLDSMRLHGFDSPMLARVRAYTVGAVDELPLIISGVSVFNDDLYVINVRPGILRIDVFDSDARLVRVLQYEEPEPTSFTPVDLVVHSDGDSTYAFVASVSTVYRPLSLTYASHLDRYAFPSASPAH